MTPIRLLSLLIPIVAIATPSRADDANVSFKRDVAPILIQQCQTCHGPDKVKGRYRVDSFERLSTPGSSGDPAITPGQPEKSQVYRLLVAHDEDDRMPQDADPLPKAQIETVHKWIKQGAIFDGSSKTANVASYVESTATGAAPVVYKRPIPITTLAFTPDGQSLLASGFCELTKWDPKTGKLTGRIPLPIQRVQAIAIDDASGRIAVVGGTPGVSGELLLLEPTAAAGTPATRSDGQGASTIRSILKLADVIQSVRFSPDGRTIAVGGADGSLRVFDVASAKLRWKADPHADWVTDIAFSPDGEQLVTASRDKSCRVFQVTTGVADASYQDHPEPVFAVVFTGDGGHVFSAGRDRRLHMWASSNGNAKGTTGGFGGDIVRLVRVGNRIYSACADGAFREHAGNEGVVPKDPPKDEKSRDQKKKQPEKPQPRVLTREIKASKEWLYSIAASEKAGLAAVGSHDGKVHIYAINDGKPVKVFVAAP